MFDLAHESFAKHGDKFFLEEKRGVLIISKREEIQQKRQFLFSQRQKVLEVVKQRVFDDIRKKELKRDGALKARGASGREKRDFSTAMCMYCWGKPVDGVFLFPLCEEAHNYSCLECLDSAIKNNNMLVCTTPAQTCEAKGGRFGMDEYKKAIRKNEECEFGLSALLSQFQAPDSFSLTHDLPTEAVLLTDQTAVTLSNIEISSQLFLVLLEKTRVTIGERVSIAKHTDTDNCIQESGRARNSPVCLGRHGAVSSFVLENIERMPPSSIGCVLREINLTDTDLINILPKLRIHENCEVERLCLNAKEKEHVAGILEQEKPVCVGRVKKMFLGDYAVGVITKRSLEDSEVEWLVLDASEEGHVSAALAQGQPVCVGRVKNMSLMDYALGILPKLRTHEYSEIESLSLYTGREEQIAPILGLDQMFCAGGVKSMWLREYAVCVIAKTIRGDSEVEKLRLSASEEEHVAAVLAQEKPVCVGRVKEMLLRGYAVGILPKLRTHENCVVESLGLDADEKEHVAAVLGQSQMFCVGRVKNILLLGYAVGILPKLRTHGDCVVESLGVVAREEEHVSAVLGQEQPFCVGGVKNMSLKEYAVGVITKMRVCEDNTMENFVLSADKKHFSRILGEGDSSIELGRVRRSGFKVPREIRRKLRYTLVDGKGKKVLEEIIFLRNKAAIFVLFLAICFSYYLWL
ncbi:MAG: uncharacterized protein A8A55_2130 [Amphiamblys sp. WSBS2006]|nr:MAG: uncharacterized protein A8A55_2130 [Amphiamblys sp. WSBS2006]